MLFGFRIVGAVAVVVVVAVNEVFSCSHYRLVFSHWVLIEDQCYICTFLHTHSDLCECIWRKSAIRKQNRNVFPNGNSILAVIINPKLHYFGHLLFSFRLIDVFIYHVSYHRVTDDNYQKLFNHFP